MQKRTINGVDFIRVRNHRGPGFSYFADGGPGGQILALDTGEFQQGTVSALAHWDVEPYNDDEPEPPKVEFNLNHGWR